MLDFADGLSCDGFQTLVPCLAGPLPSDRSVDRLKTVAELCISREVLLLARGRTSPVVTPLRALAAHARTTSRAPGAGFVGMSSVGLLAQRVASGATGVYVTRFSADRNCPPQRARAIEKHLGVAVDELQSGPGNTSGLRPREHSVLSVAPTRCPPGPAQQRLAETRRRVVAFLRDRLERRPEH